MNPIKIERTYRLLTKQSEPYDVDVNITLVHRETARDFIRTIEVVAIRSKQGFRPEEDEIQDLKSKAHSVAQYETPKAEEYQKSFGY